VGLELVIPNRPSTEIATGFHLRVRNQVQAVSNIDEVAEGRRRLAAWQAYVTNRNQRDELQAASRWCEMRIGALLGKGEAHRPKKTSPASEVYDIAKDDRHKFRQLYENRKIIEPLILKGTVSRAKLLAAIKKPPVVQGVGDAGRAVGFLSELRDEKFGCIYADPPWKYGNQGTRAATRNHYVTLSVDDLCQWDVGSHAADDSHLHLWTTNAFLPDAFRVIAAWGFEYRSCFVWVKPQMGIGNYWRVSHEFLLFGVRGNAKRFNSKNLKSWGVFARTKHSAKPDEVRTLIEQASSGPYLELFGRKEVQGWTVLGNDVEAMSA